LGEQRLDGAHHDLLLVICRDHHADAGVIGAVHHAPREAALPSLSQGEGEQDHQAAPPSTIATRNSVRRPSSIHPTSENDVSSTKRRSALWGGSGAMAWSRVSPASAVTVVSA